MCESVTAAMTLCVQDTVCSVIGSRVLYYGLLQGMLLLLGACGVVVTTVYIMCYYY